jgi:hypothetical protein
MKRTRRVPDDVALAIGPVLAWRTWGLSGRGRNLRLRPVCGYGRPWPSQRPAVAACLKRRHHAAPIFECTCGLHGTREPAILQRTKSPAVVGTVALWGTVIEHTLGYRAKLGYPQALRLVCPVCFFQRGIDDSQEPEIVAVLTRERLLPLCAEHRDTASAVDLPVRSLRRVDDVRDALLDTYRSDELDTPRLAHSESGRA